MRRDNLPHLVVAVLLIVVEIFTLTAAVGLLGGAALITALAAAIFCLRACLKNIFITKNKSCFCQ